MTDRVVYTDGIRASRSGDPIQTQTQIQDSLGAEEIEVRGGDDIAAPALEVSEDGVGIGLGDGADGIADDADAEAELAGVDGGGADAVVGGEADDDEVGDRARVQDARERRELGVLVVGEGGVGVDERVFALWCVRSAHVVSGWVSGRGGREGGEGVTYLVDVFDLVAQLVEVLLQALFYLATLEQDRCI